MNPEKETMDLDLEAAEKMRIQKEFQALRSNNYILRETTQTSPIRLEINLFPNKNTSCSTPRRPLTTVN